MAMIDALRRHLPPAEDLGYLNVLLETVVFALVLLIIVTARHPVRAARAIIT